MLKELKLAFKLVRFGLQFKMNVIMAVVFLVIGIVVEVGSQGQEFLGSFYVVLTTLFIYQLIISLDVSKLVQSSGYKRKIQIKYPNMAMLPIAIILFTIVVIEHSILAFSGSADVMAAQANVITEMAVILAMVLIFFGLVYKFMLLSTVIFIVLVAASSALFEMFNYYAVSLVSRFSWGELIALSYGVVILGAVISVLLSKLFYKKEISSWAFRNALAREMK